MMYIDLQKIRKESFSIQLEYTRKEQQWWESKSKAKFLRKTALFHISPATDLFAGNYSSLYQRDEIPYSVTNDFRSVRGKKQAAKTRVSI